jgi:hypothetical protein
MNHLRRLIAPSFELILDNNKTLVAFIPHMEYVFDEPPSSGPLALVVGCSVDDMFLSLRL